MFHASISDIVRSATVEPISAEEEAALVRAAQTGDEDAMVALMRQYAQALRNALARFGETLDPEDAEQEAAVAFLSLVKAHDPATGRLAGRVNEYLVEGLHEAASKTNNWSIPARTTKRFFSILKKADGDVAEGARIAPENDMAETTFLLLANLLRGTESLNGLVERSDEEGATDPMAGVIVGGEAADAFASVDDRILVEGLIALLDERETAIIRYAYGFDDLPLAADEDPKAGVAKTREEGIAVANDATVARVMGLTRPTVQRARTKALATMREAVTVEDVAA